MLRRTLLLVLALCLGTSVMAIAQEGRRPALGLPERNVKISQPIEIGELRNQLELDLKLSPRLEMQDPKLFLDVTLSEPDLYSKLLAAFTSRAESGCSMIYRQGEAKKDLEAQLCSVRKLSIAFDPAKRSGLFRASARMRNRIGGIQEKVLERALALETSIGFKDGSLVLRPTALDVAGLPRDASELLLEKFDESSFFLHRCLNGNDLEVEDLRLEEGKNEIKIRASSDLAASLRILNCFGSEGGGIALPGQPR